VQLPRGSLSQPQEKLSFEIDHVGVCIGFGTSRDCRYCLFLVFIRLEMKSFVNEFQLRVSLDPCDYGIDGRPYKVKKSAFGFHLFHLRPTAGMPLASASDY
jgi:hypothetical protein